MLYKRERIAVRERERDLVHTQVEEIGFKEEHGQFIYGSMWERQNVNG